ncbi:hypothetical protein ACFWBB_23340 [Streptomyces sp. NPDC060000]
MQPESAGCRVALDLADGVTTVWERWNSSSEETGFGPVGMNSFNH